jgi:hypothetical protein
VGNCLLREHWWTENFDLWENLVVSGTPFNIVFETDYLKVTRVSGAVGAGQRAHLENTFDSTGGMWRHSVIGSGSQNTTHPMTYPIEMYIEFEIVSWDNAGGGTNSLPLAILRGIDGSFNATNNMVISGIPGTDLRMSFSVGATPTVGLRLACCIHLRGANPQRRV